MQPTLQLPSLLDVRVLVIGDVMLDRYWYGDAQRVSQEAPVPVVDVKTVRHLPGGAANTALNVASLGAQCTLVGVVGEDEAAVTLRATLEAAGVECDFVQLADWPTIVKLRIVSQNQQLLRTDFETPMPEVPVDAVFERVRAHLSQASGVVLQDYDKGTLAEPKAIVAAARAQGLPVVVDPKHKSFSDYAGATVLKPNVHEFARAVGDWTGDDALVQSAQAEARAHDIGALVITRGGQGMVVVSQDGSHAHLAATPVDVFDVTGAGDTAAATLGVTQALGWSALDCASVANVASGLAVAKSGTAAVTGPELAHELARRSDSHGVLTRGQLLDAAGQAKAAGKRVVFTNGCFDILHAGHVAYLQEAAQLGDLLVVAVNDDASVTRLKGAGRPVNALERRLTVLAGLGCVDWVVGFNEDTPEPLLHELKPDILVKGGDYGDDEVVGADIVRGYGGNVVVLSLVDDCSTTAIVDAIKGTS